MGVRVGHGDIDREVPRPGPQPKVHPVDKLTHPLPLVDAKAGSAAGQLEGGEAQVGVLWFDAHGDFNTPRTTLSGMLGGMPVAVCAGLAHPRWRERSYIVAPLPVPGDLWVVTDGRGRAQAVLRITEVRVLDPYFYY